MKKFLFTLIFLLPTVSFGAITNADLSHTYKYENNCVDDINGNDCTTSGTYGIYGLKFGSYSLNVNGSGFSAISTGMPTATFSGSFSISTWVRHAGGYGLGNWILEGYSSTYANYWFALYENGGGTLNFDMYDGPSNGNHNPTLTSSVAINDTNLHNIVIVRDTGACTLTIYIDGSSSGSTTDTTCSATNFYSLKFSMGSRNDASQYFNGSLDETYVFNRALTSGEVTQLQSLELPTGGGGGGATTTLLSASSQVPATLYSSKLLNDIVSTSTYTYLSPGALTGNKQVALVYITHLASTTPVVSWGGNAMSRIATTTSEIDSYVTHLYYLAHPPSGISNVLITGITASSTKFISSSVWSNADAPYVLGYQDSGYLTYDAYVDVFSTTTPYTTTVDFFVGDYDEKILVGQSKPIVSATTTLGGIDRYQGTLLSSLCNSSTVCQVGYKFTGLDGWGWGHNAFSIGINLYATTSVSLSASSTYVSFISSSTVSIPTDTFSTLSSQSSFGECFNGLFSSVVSGNFWSDFGKANVCMFQTFIYWVFSLFVPTSQQVVDMNTYWSASMNNGQITTAFFGFFYHLKYLADLVATTSVSMYGFTIPTSISGGTFATSTQYITIDSSDGLPTAIDQNMANFLSPFFAVFGFFMFAILMLRFIM